MLGADVLHVESTARPDGTRLLAGLPFSEDDWWERSGLLPGLNTNKRSVTLDLTDEPGRALLPRLLETCAALAEHYTPPILEHIGPHLTHARHTTTHPALVWRPPSRLDTP